MDRPTAAAYARHAGEWIAARGPRPLATKRLERFASRLPRGARVADLGSGPAWYAGILREGGFASVALDLTPEMLHEAGRRYPQLPRVQADLGALPFARGSLDGAWAINCLTHLSAAELPPALAHLHHALRTDAIVEFTLADLESVDPTPAELRRGSAQRRFGDDRLRGRLFTAVTKDRARMLLEGAGFERIRIERPEQRRFWLWIRARRSHTLPDYLRPDLDLLVCGLNPSLRAAESGIPFITGSNRFWAAARKAGLIDRERDPWEALRRGLGFTDLVKRPTRGASELTRAEYTTGLERLQQRVGEERPRAVCFVGLDGWRRAVDRRAVPGWLGDGVGGRPAYLMPSTSGRNAQVDLATLVRHLRRASRGPSPRR